MADRRGHVVIGATAQRAQLGGRVAGPAEAQHREVAVKRRPQVPRTPGGQGGVTVDIA